MSASTPWHAETRALYAGGTRIVEIARALGRHESTVRYALDRRGDRARALLRARRSRRQDAPLDGVSIDMAETRFVQPHVPRVPKIVPNWARVVRGTAAAFARGEIFRAELARRLAPEPAP